MGILNVTPDSFSDGGQFFSVDDALRRAEKMIADGADIIDIGGESTRPSTTRERVSAEVESTRVLPVIQALASRSDIPISIDTTKPAVARSAVAAGAEIINDISGLRWEPLIADIAVSTGAGLVLMHSRGEFHSLHTEPPVEDIVAEVISSLHSSIHVGRSRGVAAEQIVLDVGIGFGKTVEQNLELMRELKRIVDEFENYPILVGTSRKSFIGRVAEETNASERVGGSLATALLALNMGARILRVHDVKETVQAVRVVRAIMEP